MSCDRIVVGAGLSGMLAALEYAEQGHRVTVIDAAPQLGGALASAVVDGFRVDTGADAFSTARGDMRELAEQWGLGDDVVTPSGRQAHSAHADGLYPLGPGVFGIPAGHQALRAAPGLQQAAIEQAIASDSAPWRDDPSWSVAELVRQRLGSTVLERLVDPVISGVFGAPADELAWDAVCPELVQTARETGSILTASQYLRGGAETVGLAVASLRGGLHRLVETAEQRLLDAGVRIKQRTAVSHLERISGGWIVGAGTERFVPNVTLAVGPRELRRLLGTAGWEADTLPAIEPTPSRVVVVSVESEALDQQPLGTGVLVAPSYGGEAKAVTHLNAKWGWWQDVLPLHRHLLRLSMARPQEPREGVRRAVETALESLVGVERSALRDMVVQDWPDTLTRPAPGMTASVQETVASARGWGLDIRGAGIAGNGLLRIATDHHTRRMKESDDVFVSG